MQLDGGRPSLEPFVVDLPDGSAEARFLFHPMETTTEIALAAKVTPFDYGGIARWIDPPERDPSARSREKPGRLRT
jgi:hypothetical protein